MMAIYHSTLLVLIAVALLSPSGLFISQSHALQGVNAPPARRVDHIDMNARMVKKRGSAPVPNVPLVKRQGTSTGGANPSATPSTAPTNGQGNNSQTNGDQNTSTCNGLLDCLLNGGNGNNNSQTSTTSTPPAATSTAATSTKPTSTQAPSSSSSQTSATPRTTGTRTTIVTATDSFAQTSSAAQDQSSSFLPKSAIIGLIVAASCVVGGAAIWTVIRKWKFSPSRHFEDRLEPINWEPTQASGLPHDPTVAAIARGAGSHRGNGSIGSSEDQHNGRNMTAVQDQPISMAPDFPPAHDFTAGAAGGGLQGGYVDMNRGPSPAPNTYGNYGRYETPNPYDAYDYNAGYGQRRY